MLRVAHLPPSNNDNCSVCLFWTAESRRVSTLTQPLSGPRCRVHSYSPSAHRRPFWLPVEDKPELTPPTIFNHSSSAPLANALVKDTAAKFEIERTHYVARSLDH